MHCDVYVAANVSCAECLLCENILWRHIIHQSCKLPRPKADKLIKHLWLYLRWWEGSEAALNTFMIGRKRVRSLLLTILRRVRPTPVLDNVGSIAYHHPVKQANARLTVICSTFNNLVIAGIVLAIGYLANIKADSQHGVEPYLCVQSLMFWRERLPATFERRHWAAGLSGKRINLMDLRKM